MRFTKLINNMTTPINENKPWQEEFDDRFVNLTEEDDSLTILTREDIETLLKPFISEIEQQAIERTKAEVLKTIEEMGRETDNKWLTLFGAKKVELHEQSLRNEGYNEFISDLKQKLTKHK